MAEVPEDPPYGRVPLVENDPKSTEIWTLALGREEAWIVRAGAPTAFALTHRELTEHGDVVLGNFIRAFVVRGLAGSKAKVFKLEPETIRALRAWMSTMPGLHLLKALKKRLRFSLPIGLMVTITALPVLGNDLDPFALAFGVGLVGLSTLGPLRPHASLFFVEGLLWFSLTVSNARVALGGSTWSMFFALLTLGIGVSSLRAFSFYRGLYAAGAGPGRVT